MIAMSSIWAARMYTTHRRNPCTGLATFLVQMTKDNGPLLDSMAQLSGELLAIAARVKRDHGAGGPRVAAPPWSGPYTAPRCVRFAVLGLPVLPAARGAAACALTRAHTHPRPPPRPPPRQPNPPSTAQGATGGISFLKGSGSAAACTNRPITTQRTAARRETRRDAPCASGGPTPCASGAMYLCAQACARATGALQRGIGTSS